jgi:branched-chain amino acid aminotransferase group I
MISSPVIPDARNANIMIFVGDRLYPRNEAKISVFDSLVQGGDGIWEGLRLINGKVHALDKHLERLYDSAKAMHFAHVPDVEFIRNAIDATIKANDMFNDVHIRLTLSRGTKVTSGMSPHWNQYGCTLIVIAEWKPPVFGNQGLKLITSAVRRNNPSSLDSKIHHNNLINNILAKIQANHAGVDEAVMLDMDGFVAETNACNIFFVKNENILTPQADACLPGITRGEVIELAHSLGLTVKECRISMAEMYSADEVFLTGTMGGLTHVVDIDGRSFDLGPLTVRLMDAYSKHLYSN